MTTRWVGVGLAAALALAGCGSDDASVTTSQPPTDTAGTATTPASTDESPATASPTVTTPAADDAPPATEASGGASECSVTISGDVTAEWTSTATGFQAFVYGGWLSNPSSEDASAFGANCYDTDFNIVGFFAAPGTEIPMEPATYELTGDPADPISADVAVIADDGLWETTSGLLEILEFDERHIRARFSLAVEDSFDPTRTAEITGEFAHAR